MEHQKLPDQTAKKKILASRSISNTVLHLTSLQLSLTFLDNQKNKMPSTLQKTRKQISKKRGGVVDSLHEKSRDSMRLHKAGIRDQRIERLAASRNKKEQPLGQYISEK